MVVMEMEMEMMAQMVVGFEEMVGEVIKVEVIEGEGRMIGREMTRVGGGRVGLPLRVA